MLPVALTCPLWWVARWAARVLTSLAVVAALALGAGMSPASAAAPEASGAAPSPFTAASAASSAAPGSLTLSSAVVPGTGHAAPGVTEAATGHVAAVASVDPQPARAAGPGAVLAAPTAVTLARGADAERLPRTDARPSRATRAPPGR
ncbi:hypothetical protein DKT68_07020 [Micromonospora acroterricola]|uniref:Uncharacterized protein n=1 Tax=Micromonospora acroterricola TaxID=2202421 RepID=A0A317DAG8_9ACTN|nr:hypothetical protein [Micromonospora acroterricola]PWR11080.1 hypothetical protein DKT68_07020 [Micromonospora acroterricola]